MSPESARDEQLRRYRAMDGEARLKIALDLHELSCNIARESIRARYPGATHEQVEQKLRERIRAAYSSAIAAHDQ